MDTRSGVDGREAQVRSDLIESSSILATMQDESVDASLSDFLGHLGQRMEADRSFLFRFDEANDIVQRSHQWALSGEYSGYGGQGPVHAPSEFPWIMSRLMAGEAVLRFGGPEMSAAAQADWAKIAIYGARRMMLVPLRTTTRALGLLGVSRLRDEDWDEHAEDFLVSVGVVLASALRRVDAETQRRAMQGAQGLLAALATELISQAPEQIDAAIGPALARLGRLTGVDRAYLFQRAPGAASMDLRHEWCRDGVGSHRELYSRVALDRMQPWTKILERGGVIRVPCAEQDPEAWVRDLLKPLGRGGLLLVPIHEDGAWVGLVGFDWVQPLDRPTDDEERLLWLVARMLGNAGERRRRDEDLLIERQRLADVITGIRAGTWRWDFSTRSLWFNQRWLDMLGEDSAADRELRQQDWVARIHPEDLPRVVEVLRAQLRGEEGPPEIEARLQHRAGHWVWMALRGLITGRDADGRALAMSGIGVDISPRKNAEARLRLADAVFCHTHEGILVTDARNRIVDVNACFERITGYGRDEVLGRDPKLLQSGRQSPADYAEMWQSLQTRDWWTGEVWNRRKDGAFVAELLTISIVRDDNGRVQNHIGVFSDITAVKERERLLERSVHYDALTGLPNRVLLAERLRQAMQYCESAGLQLALAVLDVDGFKDINLRHGHAFGDRYLCALAEQLGGLPAESDCLARLGGDEFVLLFNGLQASETDARLGELRSRLHQQISVDGLALPVSASIGVTVFPQAGASDPDQLIRQADHAMTMAKEAGRGSLVFFDLNRQLEHQRRSRTLSRLAQALKRGELLLHYQPQLDLRSGKVHGIEALLRWQHPERGLLLPGEFIDDLREGALGHRVGEWVIKQALHDQQQLAAQGHPLVVSVNLAVGLLLRPDFPDFLAGLKHSGTSQLVLEILETDVLADLEAATAAMRACTAHGPRFALDDFGTGYSSLRFLRHLPVSELKIDCSFVRGMLDDRADEAIVNAIIQLGEAFGLEVTAEGVEADEQADQLLQMGCGRAQGYAIARPMPKHALLQWLQDGVRSSPADRSPHRR